MAGVARQLCRSSALSSVLRRAPSSAAYFSNRSFSAKSSDEPPSDSASDEQKESWFSRLMPVRKIDPGTESHSSLLADKDTVYELQIHSVKPEFMEKYLGEYETFVNRVHNKETGAQLAGSWTVEIGDQDEAIHLWKYPGGYPTLNHMTHIYRTEKEFVDFRISRNKMLRSRRNQILLAFSFWGDPEERDGSNIYELRSYVLKPGTMIEWGNNWARGIKTRREKNEAVAGFFSQIGDLYNVHHLWAYETLQDRKEIRENVWHRPGWDACVSHTVPLIRHMTARILVPTPFSPLR
eukprot:GHVO01025604.1.p1 GENE.GHVO01025604.1~~GHVO01025604.1.p1  ORF type:complete len:294 (-),score=12.04 GHVO01025604.1:256-1137(-)